MSIYDKVIDEIVAVNKRKTEAVWHKVVHDFDSTIRGFLIELDAIDPKLGDRLVTLLQGALAKIAEDRAITNEGITS